MLIWSLKCGAQVNVKSLLLSVAQDGHHSGDGWVSGEETWRCWCSLYCTAHARLPRLKSRLFDLYSQSIFLLQSHLSLCLFHQSSFKRKETTGNSVKSPRAIKEKKLSKNILLAGIIVCNVNLEELRVWTGLSLDWQLDTWLHNHRLFYSPSPSENPTLLETSLFLILQGVQRQWDFLHDR